MLVDSHCHLAAPEFDADREAVLARAWAAGVAHLVVIGESPEAAERSRNLAGSDRRISATAGLHPHEASRWSPELARWLAGALGDEQVVAAGETGLDYHYDHSPRQVQREAFEQQLELARAAGKPAVVHAREADEDVATILGNHPGVTAILHSFSSGIDLLRTAAALGHYVSLSGMITFKGWQLADAIRLVDRERLLVETDAPYLAPVPHRGHRNEPAHVRLVAERLAQMLDLTKEEIIAITGRNARRVFGPRLTPGGGVAQ
jgi:TatD DNase family protein